MLTTKQHKAIELLLCNTEEQAAKELRIRNMTIRRWLKKSDFAKALQDAERRQRKALVRIVGNAILNAAITLSSEIDLKTALEILKLSKVLEHQEDDLNETLDDFVRGFNDDSE